MKAYLINLDRSPERLSLSDAELKAAGVPYVRVQATDGRQMTPEDVSSHCSRLGFFLANGHRVKTNEVACLLSHRSCWRRLLESGEARAAVFEDDVLVDGAAYAQATALVEKDDDASPAVWLLHHRNLVPDPGRPAVVRLLDTPRNALTCWGAFGYVLNRAAAERLLRLSEPMRYVADDWNVYARRGVDVRVAFPTACRVREDVGSDIARKTTGRAGWKWYLAFGRWRHAVAFRLNLLLRRGEG